MTRPTRTTIREQIRAMTDADLKALTTELAIDAALKQSMLATARREMKRRARAARSAA